MGQLCLSQPVLHDHANVPQPFHHLGYQPYLPSQVYHNSTPIWSIKSFCARFTEVVAESMAHQLNVQLKLVKSLGCVHTSLGVDLGVFSQFCMSSVQKFMKILDVLKKQMSGMRHVHCQSVGKLQIILGERAGEQ